MFRIIQPRSFSQAIFGFKQSQKSYTTGGRNFLCGSEGLTEEQRGYYDAAVEFAQQEMSEKAGEWDRTEHFPKDVLSQLGKMGFGSIYVREEFGGTGLNRVEAASIFEALASHGCVSTTAYLTIHNMCAWMLSHFGSPQLVSRYLPPLLDLSETASYCLTEPSSGSDAASLKTTARQVDGDWVLNGSKAFISGAGESSVYLVMCRTDPENAPPNSRNQAKGISCILVPKDAPGLSFGAKEKKLGWNSQPTRAVFFEDCRVPVGNLVGNLNEGFKIAMAGLDGGRVNIGACSVGGADGCIRAATSYVTQRSQFNQPISAFQNTQFELATLASNLVASRRMIRAAAEKIDQNDPEKTVHCAMAKRFATDTCFEIANRSLQLFGGYGYLKDYPIERIMRDLRVHQILEGTNQVMNVIISRRLLE